MQLTPKLATHLVRGKVLELNDQIREHGRHFVHKLLHQLVHLLLRDTRVAQTEVERVLQELLVVGADINADRDGGVWADSISAEQNGSALVAVSVDLGRRNTRTQRQRRKGTAFRRKSACH